MCIKGYYQQCGKATHRMGENKCNHISDKESISRIYRAPTTQPRQPKQSDLKMGKGFEYFPKDDIQIATSIWKDGQRDYIRECKSKPQWENTSHPLGWLLTKKKCVICDIIYECEETGILLHFWQDYKMVTTTMEKSKEVPKKLNIELSYNPAILLLGMYPKEMKAESQREYLHTYIQSNINS